MSKWKNKGKGYGDNSTIQGSDISFGQFRLSIHRHISYPKDKWLATCGYLFSCRELSSKDLEQAKIQAKSLLQCILQNALDKIISK